MWEALLGALVGGLVVVLIQGENQRGAELRTRRLEAVDDFLHDLTIAVRLCRQAWSRVEAREEPDDASLARAVDDAERKLVRVELLFPRDHPIPARARTLVGSLKRLQDGIVTAGWPTTEPYEAQGFRFFDEVGAQFDQLVRAMYEHRWWKVPFWWAARWWKDPFLWVDWWKVPFWWVSSWQVPFRWVGTTTRQVWNGSWASRPRTWWRRVRRWTERT